MLIYIKLFTQVLFIVIWLFLATTFASIMNRPSDGAVLLGVVGQFISIAILWYATRTIWKKHSNIMKEKK